ncbi:MAG TPA: hypothetical protein VMH86_15675 [Rhizomicrobium sp.]|nr:hypothetical protein [Rhizomicrobium sp.]
MRLFAVAAIAAASLVLAACGPKPGQTVKIDGKDAHVTVSGDNGTVTVKSDDGKQTVQWNAGGMGSAQMPDFAPLYPGAKVEGSVAANSSEGGLVAFEASAKPEEVIAFYRQKSTAAGLQQKLNMTMEGGLTYMASRDNDKKAIQVVATRTGDGSHVQVTWQNKN